MKYQKGFTLIEVMISFVMIMILGTIILNAVGITSGNSNVSYGVNGMTESRCIENYKFIIDQKGNSRQILDEFGKGVRCDTVKLAKPESL